jgi:hypothetical protein
MLDGAAGWIKIIVMRSNTNFRSYREIADTGTGWVVFTRYYISDELLAGNKILGSYSQQ